jgi:hypothetical protein
MRTCSEILNQPSVRCLELNPSDGGRFFYKFKGHRLLIIASWGLGWDHVSVSLANRSPTWDEMEAVKRAFFSPRETAMQLHVPPSEHINYHSYCLHLWRPQGAAIPKPPAEMVGPPS